MYHLVFATKNDFNFIYRLIKITMKAYYEKTYGKRNEKIEKQYFKDDFDALQFQLIMFRNKKIGCLAATRFEDHVFINEIHILPGYQNKGIGKSVMTDIINEAISNKLPVQLEVLKVNLKARNMYENFGFDVYDETETHYKMIRSTAAIGSV